MWGRSSKLSRAARKVAEQALAEGAPMVELQRAIEHCYECSLGAGPEEEERILAALAPALVGPDLDRSLAVAFLCGALIEDGAPTSAVEAPLLDLFRQIAATAHRFHVACEEHLSPDTDDLETALDDAAQALAPQMSAEFASSRHLAKSYAPAIALLSASASARRRGRDMAADLSPMRGVNLGAHWIWKLLAILDDEPYVAIEPASGMGIRGRMSGISENYQLNVLLMDVFPARQGTPRRVSERAALIARGQGPQKVDETISGAWNLLAWQSVGPDGQLPAKTDRGARQHWIWNEGIPADIPTFEGARVILLAPPSYIRAWWAQRDFAGLAAELTVEERFGDDAVRAWLARMSSGRARQ